MVIMETRNVESIFTIVGDGQKETERERERDQRRNAKRRTKV